MSKTIDHLDVPTINLTAADVGNGRFKVELQVPASSDSKDSIPFLEVTRNEQQTLLNGARQDIITRLGRSGFQIGDMQYETGDQSGAGGRVGGGATASELGKFTFEIQANSNNTSNISGTTRHNPDLAGAIREAESNFDMRRQDMYESRAREWYRNGGATVQSNGEAYTVTRDAAKHYINQQYPFNLKERMSADGAVQVAIASPTLLSGNDRINQLFAQALKGAGGDRDAAAVAVETISKTAGFKLDQDISVTQGKHGLIVSQGEGAASINLQVPQAKQGDFEVIAARMVAQPQQISMQQDQPQHERRGPTV